MPPEAYHCAATSTYGALHQRVYTSGGLEGYQQWHAVAVAGHQQASDLLVDVVLKNMCLHVGRASMVLPAYSATSPSLAMQTSVSIIFQASPPPMRCCHERWMLSCKHCAKSCDGFLLYTEVNSDITRRKLYPLYTILMIEANMLFTLNKYYFPWKQII